MAALPTPGPTPVSAAINPALAPLRELKCPRPLAVAFSGGADSTALLIASAQVWPGQVQAIHVNHGLQPAAGAFADHCRMACDRLSVKLKVIEVDARHGSGESPEDAARKARYPALAQGALAFGAKTVLLGQHADDQVETLLLALSRGAGLPGMAAMPASFVRNGMHFERPLLGISGAAIRNWLTQEGVVYIDDPTNADIAFTRNRIRHRLLPALEETFPRFRETFARSARHAAQAQELLTALAEQDLAAMGGMADIKALQQLVPARQANLLRHWLRASYGVSASTAQLDELLRQVGVCTTRGHAVRIKVAGGLVQRADEQLVYVPSI